MFVCVVGIVYVLLAGGLSIFAAYAVCSYGDVLELLSFYLSVSQAAGKALVCLLAAAVFVFISVPGFALVALGRSRRLLARIEKKISPSPAEGKDEKAQYWGE